MLVLEVQIGIDSDDEHRFAEHEHEVARCMECGDSSQPSRPKLAVERPSFPIVGKPPPNSGDESRAVHGAINPMAIRLRLPGPAKAVEAREIIAANAPQRPPSPAP